MTDAAAINIKSLPFNLAANIIKDYFSVNGIEYSVVRIPIAGSDYSTRTYSYNDYDNDFELKHFALAKEDIDFKVNFCKNSFAYSLINSIFRFHCFKRHNILAYIKLSSLEVHGVHQLGSRQMINFIMEVGSRISLIKSTTKL